MVLTSLELAAQTKFLQAGKIEFERKINVHRQFEANESDSWLKEYISKQPRFHTTYFDLFFSGNRTVYKPGRETEDLKRNVWGLGPSKDNFVLNDLEKNEFKSLKTVFEQTFLVEDSSRKLEWKMADEIRTIAGFECRKAVAIICDSVYVVAFYSDEITVSGGPESFHGLPGMILGQAVPRLYTTWFATRVELAEPTAKEYQVPRRGKKTSESELLSTLKTSFKDWGKDAQKNIWWVML